MKKPTRIAPARGKLGILMPGMGAVSTTFMAGVELIRRGKACPVGSLTQIDTIRLGKRPEGRSPLIKKLVPLADPRDLVFGGWEDYVGRGVILSNNGIFESIPLERCEPEPVDIANPTLEDKVRQEILVVFQRANWKLRGSRGAAARLGLKRITLFYKMKRLGIAPPADVSLD